MEPHTLIHTIIKIFTNRTTKHSQVFVSLTLNNISSKWNIFLKALNYILSFCEKNGSKHNEDAIGDAKLQMRGEIHTKRLYFDDKC